MSGHRGLKETVREPDLAHLDVGMVAGHLAKFTGNDVRGRIRDALPDRMRRVPVAHLRGDADLAWPRELSQAELDAYGRGFDDGWRQGFTAGRAA